MGDLLIRGVADPDLRELKELARDNGRSLQAELQAAVRKMAEERRKRRSLDRLEEIRAMADPAKLPYDFWDQVRQERDSRPW